MPLFVNIFSLNLSKAADANAILLLIHLYHAARKDDLRHRREFLVFQEDMHAW